MRILAVALILTLSGAPVWGEALRLEDALREAVANRPSAEAARHEAEAARSSVGEARSRYWPQVTLEENYVRTTEPADALFLSLNQEELEVRQEADFYNFPDAHQEFETRLSLRQPLFNPDIYYGVRRAFLGAEAAEANAHWGIQEAAFGAFRSYLQVQQSEAALDWVRSSLREAEEILRLSSERHRAGVGLKADVLRARVFLSEAQRRLVAAENDLAIARHALAVALGRPPGAEVEIADTLAPEMFAPAEPRPLERADLQALALKREVQAAARQQARAEWLPRLGVTASYALHDGETPFGTDAGAWTLGAGMTWELFDGGRRGHAVAKAAAAEKAAAARAREARHQALLAADEARRRAEEARVTLEAARQSVSEAQESLRLTRQRFEAGLADLSELLSAQTALDRVRFDRFQADSRYLLALGNERFQQGTFLKEFLSPDKEDHR